MNERTILLAAAALAASLQASLAASVQALAHDGPAANVTGSAPATGDATYEQGGVTQTAPSNGGHTAPVPAGQDTSPPASQPVIVDIIVTAQKREQSINEISQLAKLVPGSNFNRTGDGGPVYTIRGVADQDSAIAASSAVHVVNPGMAETPMIEAFSENQRTAVKGMIPMGRFGQSQEIAKIIASLLSDDTSYITGAEVATDGGVFA